MGAPPPKEQVGSGPITLQTRPCNTLDRFAIFLWIRIQSIMARPWLVLLAITSAFLVARSSPTPPRQLATENEAGAADNTSWTKYVRGPSSKTVVPASILSQYTAGNVSNINSLAGSGTGPAVLTRLSTNDTAPVFVIDFGINVAGQLAIEFAGSSNTSEGFPGITLAFSETLQFLSDRSDFTRSDNAGGVRFIILIYYYPRYTAC